MTNPGFQENSPLRRVSDDGDFELAENASCWIGVGGLSLHVAAKDGELRVNVYPKGREMEPELSGFHGPLDPWIEGNDNLPESQ